MGRGWRGAADVLLPPRKELFWTQPESGGARASGAPLKSAEARRGARGVRGATAGRLPDPSETGLGRPRFPDGLSGLRPGEPPGGALPFAAAGGRRPATCWPAATRPPRAPGPGHLLRATLRSASRLGWQGSPRG